MQVNKIVPIQPEKSTGQGLLSQGDHVGKTTYKQQNVEGGPKPELAATRETTTWIPRDITDVTSLFNEEIQDKNMCHCCKKQEKPASNREKRHNNYFGEISFGTNHTVKYIRVHSNTTKPKHVLKLMKEKWELEKPNLLISVHGSMKGLENNSLRDTCQTSLTKVLEGKGTWMITNGQHEYVHIYETAEEQPIIVGISQWRDIHNTHQPDIKQGTSSAEDYPGNNSLDPHHTHFILIDYGSGDASYTTSNFREEFESEITKLESDNDVPFVLLVLQWDDNINKTVEDTLTKKLPVLIVKESDKNASVNKAKFEIPKDIFNSTITHICEWKVDSCESDLGLAIVQALSKADKQDGSNKLDNMTGHRYLLNIAVAWNMFRIAKNISLDIIKQIEILESCMMAAILLDEVEYVKLILDNGFDLKTFLTYKKLEELYKSQFKGSLFNEVLPNMTKQIDEDKEMNVWKHVKWLLDHVHESKPHLRYLDTIVEQVEHGSEKTCCAQEGCCCFRISCCKCTKNTASSVTNDANKPSVEENPCLDLFIWSVLNNRQDMAKLFWQQRKPDDFKASSPEDTHTGGQPQQCAGSEEDPAIDCMMDAMAAALFAHALLSAMSEKIDDKEFKEKCKEDSRNLTNLANGILKEGYKKGGVKLAKKLLIQQQKQWGNKSCVLIAVNAKNKQFVSEHACQEVFNDIWMGNKDEETGILPNNLKLLLCIFFPLLIVLWVKLKKNKPSTCAKPDNGPNPNQEHQQKKNNSKVSSEQGQEHNVWDKIKYFYQAPVVICFHNVISYMIFLGLYSYSLMSKVNRYLSWQEILLCVWAFTICIQECVQVCSSPSKDMKSKFCNYIRDGWNILDIVTLFLFLCGMILRIFDHPQVADSALVFHGVNLITFYLRLLHIFSVHKELGPKLVMIIHMVYNIFYFFMILAVFIVAYGIASYSILYPHTEPNLQTLTEIFRRPYWNIYGELMLDTIEGSPDCTNDPTLYNSGSYSRCPTEAGKYFVPVLMGVYMLMCNILLLNLLIAMFSNTFQKVENNSYLYWSFQQYSLINEYASRPFVVPPLIIFYHLYQLIVWIVSKVCKVKHCKDNVTTKHAFCVPKVHCSEQEKKFEKRYKNGITMEIEVNSSNASAADSQDLGKRMQQMEKQLNRLVQMQRENTQRARVE